MSAFKKKNYVNISVERGGEITQNLLLLRQLLRNVYTGLRDRSPICSCRQFSQRKNDWNQELHLPHVSLPFYCTVPHSDMPE